MPRVNLTILDLNNKYIDLLSTVIGTTRSQVINDILDWCSRNDAESEIWEEWDELWEAFRTYVDEWDEDEIE